MRILHVNDVASVASILVSASGTRDCLYQPMLRARSGSTTAIPSLAMGRLRDWVRIGQLMTRREVTHLHVHYASFAMLAVGRSFSLHLHGGDVLHDLTAGGLRERITRWAMRKAGHVVVSTPNLLGQVRKLRPDAQYIPNPMELPPGPAATRSAAPPAIMMVSKLDRFKGWPRQVELIQALRQELPGLQFAFPTHGKLPAAERERIIVRLRELGGRPLPPLPRSEFLGLIQNADVVLGQMEVGALGMSELEAMAAGVPVIADVSAFPMTGRMPPVIAPNAADVLALLSNAEARAVLGNEALDYVRAVHAPAAVLRQLEATLTT
jgi:glycosyltransferase involved in cell wall biosynthesis